MIYGFRKEKAQTLSRIADLYSNGVTNQQARTGRESLFVVIPAGGLPDAVNGESGKAKCDVMQITASGQLKQGDYKVTVHNLSDESIDADEIIRCFHIQDKWVAATTEITGTVGTVITAYTTEEIPVFNTTSEYATGKPCNVGEWTHDPATNEATIATKTQDDGNGGTENVTEIVYNVSEVTVIPNGRWILAYKMNGMYFATGYYEED